MIPSIRQDKANSEKTPVVCPRCLGRGRTAHQIKREVVDCSLCKGLRLVYKVTSYEAIPPADVEGPMNLYPRGL